MSYATCLVPPEALREEVVSLGGERHHHLFRVRRLAVGSKVRLTDGRGAARWGRVERLLVQEAQVSLGREAPSNETVLQLELWVALPRSRRATWLVEKATEVGVAAIRWLDSERAGREMTAPRLDRLRRVAEAAVEQCHRALVPDITGLHSWEEAIGRIASSPTAWFLDASGEVDADLPSRATAGMLFVGPEGGWSDSERVSLAASGALAVGLGPRQLRVETAAIAGASLILCRSGC